jgi:hypothetical protein
MKKLMDERDGALKNVKHMRNIEAENSQRLERVMTQLEELVIQRDKLKADVRKAEGIVRYCWIPSEKSGQDSPGIASDATLTIERDGVNEGRSVNIETEPPLPGSDSGFDRFPLSKPEALLSVESGEMIDAGASNASADVFSFNVPSPEEQGAIEPSSNVNPPTMINGNTSIPAVDETDGAIVPRSDTVEGEGASFIVGTANKRTPAATAGTMTTTTTTMAAALKRGDEQLSDIGTEEKTYPKNVVTGVRRSPQKRRGTKRTHIEARMISKRRRNKSTTL